MLAEVFRRLESELGRSASHRAYWPGDTEPGPGSTAPGYALVVVLVRSDDVNVAMAPSARSEVEALLQRIAEGGRSPSPTGGALPAAVAENLRLAELRTHSLSWDAHAGDGCVCERLCAHMQLAESQLLLDARIVPKAWSGLAMLWHALGPTHLTRLLASGALNSLGGCSASRGGNAGGAGGESGAGGDCSDFLAQFCNSTGDGSLQCDDLLRIARGRVTTAVMETGGLTAQEGSAGEEEEEDQAAACAS